MVGCGVLVRVGVSVSSISATAGMVGVGLPLKTPLAAKTPPTMSNTATTPMTGSSQTGRFLGSSVGVVMGGDTAVFGSGTITSVLAGVG